MESVAFFQKKISLTPKNLNKVGKDATIESALLQKLREKLENKCSEHGFVIPDTLKLISRSMGYFEPGSFTGDAVYYVKAEGKVYYPADGVKVIGEVLRKNKMGLYVTYKKALKIQVPRDLHLGNEDFESVEIGDTVEVELKKSLFQINDPFILVNGLYIRTVSKEEAAKSATASASVLALENQAPPEGKDGEEEEEEEEEEESGDEGETGDEETGEEEEEEEEEEGETGDEEREEESKAIVAAPPPKKSISKRAPPKPLTAAEQAAKDKKDAEYAEWLKEASARSARGESMFEHSNDEK
jgi:DNA-directed RNA polymerase subunit E'/Rpb7